MKLSDKIDLSSCRVTSRRDLAENLLERQRLADWMQLSAELGVLPVTDQYYRASFAVNVRHDSTQAILMQYLVSSVTEFDETEIVRIATITYIIQISTSERVPFVCLRRNWLASEWLQKSYLTSKPIVYKSCWTLEQV